MSFPYSAYVFGVLIRLFVAVVCVLSALASSIHPCFHTRWGKPIRSGVGSALVRPADTSGTPLSPERRPSRGRGRLGHRDVVLVLSACSSVNSVPLGRSCDLMWRICIDPLG